jgi:sulfate-transporting ATPase
MLFNDPTLTGLDTGLVVSAPTLFGISLNSVTGARAFGLFVLAVFLLAAVAVALVRRSPLGMRFLAIRANERGAAAAGISIVRTKLAAFALAGAVAGLAGGLMAYQDLNVSFGEFTTLASITYLSLAYLGGITSVGGALTAGILVVSGGVVSNLFGTGTFSTTWIPVLAGLGTMQIVVTQPEGLVGTNVALLRSAWRALRRRAGRGPALEAQAAGVQAPVAKAQAPVADPETTGGTRHV